MSLWRSALVAVVVFLVLLGTTGLSRGHILTGDTPGLVGGTRAALDCMHEGRWTRCGRIDAHDSSVRAFPLLQYIPAAAMVQAGWSDHRILRALGGLSFAAFLATLALALRAGRHLRSPVWTPLLLAVMLTGPLLFYSTSAFGEMLSVALVLGCTVAVLERRPVLIAALALLAGLGKETLPPLIVMIGLVVGRDERDDWLPPWRVLGPLVGGSAVAVGVASAFNQFRFGSFTNRNYLQPAYRIGHVRAARNLWDLLVAPDGGLVWFWTSMSLLLVALVFVALGLRRHPRTAGPSLFVLLTFAALMVGLATWWSPFGWVAWGPRLALPILPALAVAAAYAGAERLSAAVGWVLRRPLPLLALLTVVLVSAWPQAGAPWQADRLARLIQVLDSTCPVRPPRFTEAYYDCSDHIAWRHDHNQLIEATTGGGRAALAAQIVLVAAVTLLVLEARRRARASTITPPLQTAPRQEQGARAGSRRCR